MLEDKKKQRRYKDRYWIGVKVKDKELLITYLVTALYVCIYLHTCIHVLEPKIFSNVISLVIGDNSYTEAY